jgi:hypothetical protein
MAQYALLLLSRLEKLSPYEQVQVIQIAHSLASAMLDRDMRRQQIPAAFVEDE